MNKIDAKTPNKEPDWKNILETKKSLRNYLSRRVVELTSEVKNQPTTLEKTTIIHRVKWVAEIIYHTLAAIIFGTGKLLGKICSNKLHHKCQIHFFNHGTKLFSRVEQFECPNNLLVKAHNGFNLKRSTIALRTDLKYDKESFDMSTIKGNCFGTCYLFNLLYLEGKKKFPEFTERELLIKIAHLMEEGATPEASIFQLMPSSHLRKHLSSFKREADEFIKIRPEERVLERIDIIHFESKGKNPEGIKKLKELRKGIPYLLTTRASMADSLHATLVIRTGEEEFYWFDPDRGLMVFNGKDEIKKLLRLWGYGTQKKSEKESLNKCQKTLDRTREDFVKRHNLNDVQKDLLKNVEVKIKEGKSWNHIVNMQGVKNQQNLIRHYYETFREHVNNLNAEQFEYGKVKGVFLTPMQHSVIGKRAKKSQLVACYYWSKNRTNELVECPLLR